MPDQVRKEMLYTPEQNNALANLMTVTDDRSYADLIRRLIADEAARLGLEWPDNMPTKKDNARKGISKRWPQKE